MNVITVCPACKSSFDVDRRYVGKALTCPQCHGAFVVIESRSKKSQIALLVVGVLMAVAGSSILGFAAGRFSAPENIKVVTKEVSVASDTLNAVEDFRKKSLARSYDPSLSKVDRLNCRVIHFMYSQDDAFQFVRRPELSEIWLPRTQSATANSIDNPGLTLKITTELLTNRFWFEYRSEKHPARELVGKTCSLAGLEILTVGLEDAQQKCFFLEEYAKSILDAEMPDGIYDGEVEKYYPTPPKGVKVEFGNLHSIPIDRGFCLSAKFAEETGPKGRIELRVFVKNDPNGQVAEGQNQADLLFRFE